MMTGLARFLLLCTSLAPILLIYAAVLVERCEYLNAIVFAGAAVVLAVTCFFLLRGQRKASAATPRDIDDLSTKESEPVSFLVAYALPLLATNTSTETGFLAVGTFSVVMGLVLWQQQLFHINPLIGLMGYHFFKARNDDGAEVLILTKNKTISKGTINVVHLSKYFWLDTSNPRTNSNNREET